MKIHEVSYLRVVPPRHFLRRVRRRRWRMHWDRLAVVCIWALTGVLAVWGLVAFGRYLGI